MEKEKVGAEWMEDRREKGRVGEARGWVLWEGSSRAGMGGKGLDEVHAGKEEMGVVLGVGSSGVQVKNRLGS